MIRCTPWHATSTPYEVQCLLRSSNPACSPQELACEIGTPSYQRTRGAESCEGQTRVPIITTPPYGNQLGLVVKSHYCRHL